MSATNRSRDGLKTERKTNDAYPTPSWCVDRIMEALPVSAFYQEDWLEPGAGNGAIIEAVNDYCKRMKYRKRNWRAVELNPENRSELQSLFNSFKGNQRIHSKIIIGDFLKLKVNPRENPFGKDQFHVAFGNPPYKHALEFIQKALTQCNHVVFLLRTNFLASAKRHSWLSNNMPDVYLLPNRPDFTGDGGDACEYAWMHWRKGTLSVRGSLGPQAKLVARSSNGVRGGKTGTIELLNLTPRASPGPQRNLAVSENGRSKERGNR